MQRNPPDLFDEMDAMFARLVFHMEREFLEGAARVGGHGILIGDEDCETPEPAGSGGLCPQSPAATGPVPELHTHGDDVRVIVSLPGITEEELRLDLRGSKLVIDAGDADHHIHTAASVPRVDPASMQKTLKNGVLEVTFRLRPSSGPDPDAGKP